MNRKQFTFGAAASILGAMTGATMAQTATTAATPVEAGGDSVPTTPHAAGQNTYFYQDSTFEYVFLTALGSAYRQGANPGKILYISKQVQNGDSEGAYQAFKAAGDEAVSLADNSLAIGNVESARQAYVWATNYYSISTYFLDASSDPSRFLPTWELEDAAWSKAIALMTPAGKEVWIPYEGTQLRGFYFRGNGTGEKRPLLIMNNGSDGSLVDMLKQGGEAALSRGYDMLTFDGPGQNYALWKQKIYFRPDWEKVITPVVDYALALDGIDPERITLMGLSQAGYWVPRAMAFEKRIAAAVADPGIVDVATSWMGTLPQPLLELLKSGNKAAFDAALGNALKPEGKAGLAFRMRPYGMDSYFDVFTAVQQYNLTGIAENISAPMLITAPVNEAFWPGQSAELAGLVKSSTLQPFTVADGADLHCEVQSIGLRELRVFDWLAKTFA